MQFLFSDLTPVLSQITSQVNTATFHHQQQHIPFMIHFPRVTKKHSFTQTNCFGDKRESRTRVQKMHVYSSPFRFNNIVFLLTHACSSSTVTCTSIHVTHFTELTVTHFYVNPVHADFFLHLDKFQFLLYNLHCDTAKLIIKK